MNLINLASTSLFLVCMMFQASLYAEVSQAKIVKVQGDVYVKHINGKSRKVSSNLFLVNVNETVITSKSSKAVLQFNNGTISVLDEKSSLRIEKTGWLSQLGGKVYYVFRKVFGKEKTNKVITKFATIGIRGTIFIVEVEKGSQKIALQEGKLNIESPDADYEFYKMTALEENFSIYQKQNKQHQQQLKSEFTDYKKNIVKEFVEYKKHFDLEADKVVSFVGKRVDENELSHEWESLFNEFEVFSKNHINAYNELNESVQ